MQKQNQINMTWKISNNTGILKWQCINYYYYFIFIIVISINDICRS